MPTPTNPYVVFLLYLVAILGFVAFTLFLNRVLGPKPAASAVKLEAFECGAEPVDPVNVKAVPIKYYAVAIAFLLFDLETVFLFVWALGRAAVDRIHGVHVLPLRGVARPHPALRVQAAAAGSGDRE